MALYFGNSSIQSVNIQAEANSKYSFITLVPENNIVTLVNNAINILTLSTSDPLTIKFPSPSNNYARDLFLRLIVTADTAPMITWQPEDNEALEFESDNEDWGTVELGINVYMFTETFRENNNIVS